MTESTCRKHEHPLDPLKHGEPQRANINKDHLSNFSPAEHAKNGHGSRKKETIRWFLLIMSRQNSKYDQIYSKHHTGIIKSEETTERVSYRESIL